MRICSLLPSATEIVFSLGLGDQLVGVTHECDYPPAATRLPAVTRSALDHTDASSREIHNHVVASLHGGSSIYYLDQERLKKLDPDILLTQELCQVCAVSYGEVRKAVRLLPGERQVVSLEPTSLKGILESIEQVGRLTGRPERAAEVVRALQQRIDQVATTARGAPQRPRVFALEWLDPPFSGGHWVPEMVRLAGGRKGLGREGYPSAQISWPDVAAYDPEVIVLMPCGFNLAQSTEVLSRVALSEVWKGLSAVRSGQVYVVDGSAYFNRPGPRIVDGLEIMAEIIHPELFPRRNSQQAWQRLAAP